MTTCKTGAEHIKSLRDGRTVYIDGRLVEDVTEHPAFRNSVRSAAALYDFQARDENAELMTFAPDGSNRRINRCWQLPRSHSGADGAFSRPGVRGLVEDGGCLEAFDDEVDA